MLFFLSIIFPLIYPSFQIQYRSPPPFYHNPKIPPQLYISNLDKYFTLPDISYYPPPPVNPPGFTPYGDIAYQDKTRLQNNKVKTALAWKDLLRNEHHHEMHNFEMTTNSTDRNIHDVFRERYTAKIIPSQAKLDGFESYNILEMTNYISMDDRGLIYSSEGNTSCISIYNTKALTEWHQKHVETFKKQFPKSTFPLYILGNYTTDEKFKIVPGRIIHREPVTIICCGSHRNKMNIRYHINGRHPCVNCHSQMAYIPLRKLMFSRIEEHQTSTESGEWYEIDVYSVEDNNNTTSSTEEYEDIGELDKTNNTENVITRYEVINNSTNIEDVIEKILTTNEEISNSSREETIGEVETDKNNKTETTITPSEEIGNSTNIEDVIEIIITTNEELNPSSKEETIHLVETDKNNKPETTIARKEEISTSAIEENIDVVESDKNNKTEKTSTRAEEISNSTKTEDKIQKGEDKKEEKELVKEDEKLKENTSKVVEIITEENPTYEIYIRGQKVLVRNRVNTNG